MKAFANIIGFLIVLAIGFEITYYQTAEQIQFTVNSKERIVESSGSGENLSVNSKYLVFTDAETFENTDLLWIGKFNSSDVQGKLKIDSTYTSTVYGWRIPFFSMYRNLGKDVTLVQQ